MGEAPLPTQVDLLVVGGGINGAGIARDAAGRGLSALLVEQDDLAGYTSSASTKLIHGGLRYLEYGEFRLVREALIERERLLGIAPHIIWPLSFVLPQRHSPRPVWMVRLGLFLYDHLGGRKRLPATRTIRRLDRDPRGEGLKPGISAAFVYADCWVEDSRLVVLNALDAAERGATIATRTRLVAAARHGDSWTARLAQDGGETEVRARVLVNAAGPWVDHVLDLVPGTERTRHVRLVKGSHIVVPRLYGGDHAFLLQNPDRRVVFAIPYEVRFTLLGTTDIPWDGPPGQPRIDEAEIDYLLETAGRYFAKPPARADIAWTYSGIRPLHDDASADASTVTRDYVLTLDAPDRAAPLLSIFGGKITTYRKLAEHALAELGGFFPGMSGAWTQTQPLPGGDIADFAAFVADLIAARPGFPPALLHRLAHAYGTRIEVLLGTARTPDDLGSDLGDGLHEAEVAYLARAEWARTAEDILYRRSKLGLHVPAGTAERVEAFLKSVAPAEAGP